MPPKWQILQRQMKKSEKVVIIHLAKSLITLYYIFGYVLKTKLYEEAGHFFTLFFWFSLMAIETFKNHLILEFLKKSPQHPLT